MLPPLEMRKIAKQIADEVWESSERRTSLGEFSERKIKACCPQISELELSEVTEGVVEKAKVYLERRITLLELKGATARYQFDDCFADTLILTSIGDPLVDMLRAREQNLRLALKRVGWKTFQYVCKHLLEINGAVKSAVTRGTKEGGVDFFGLLEIGTWTSPMVLLKGMEIRVVGQAKHTSTNAKVGDGVIKKFAKECEDFRSDSGKAAEILPSWFVENKSPVIGVVITNGEFTRDAKKYGNRERVILRDCDQIIEDLIHSPKSRDWVYREENGNISFNENSFIGSFQNA